MFSTVSALSVADLSVGIDLVHFPNVRESLETFSDRFLRRLFTAREIEYSCSTPTQIVERIAARFAAKEAALKALGLAGSGVDWRELEVIRRADGSCSLEVHGRARSMAGIAEEDSIALSMSHDGDYAVAIVALRRAQLAARITTDRNNPSS